MSKLNYITEMLELKDNNVKFYENCYHKKIKGISHKVFNDVLTYQLTCCKKQRYLCKHCDKTFTLKTKLLNKTTLYQIILNRKLLMIYKRKSGCSRIRFIT